MRRDSYHASFAIEVCDKQQTDCEDNTGSDTTATWDVSHSTGKGLDDILINKTIISRQKSLHIK